MFLSAIPLKELNPTEGGALEAFVGTASPVLEGFSLGGEVDGNAGGTASETAATGEFVGGSCPSADPSPELAASE